MNELIIVSLIVSIIFSDVTNIIPGGIIIPFYFVLHIYDPVKIAATVLTSISCVFFIKFLSRYTILYGRRKFAMYIITGIIIKIIFTYIYFGNTYMFYNLSITIGYVVPGILGRVMERQGIIKTLGSLSIVVLIIAIVQILLM
ncbi:poly-gamma-glutamate biosynthesis protein PgsC [Sedimentibacter sp. B4]|uniref:poly-gamma-glutamate biosynthesis protein PgsC n=1 Tax=Sedimentibacter sp. B4 TaxID=304766 RepID=UPI0002E3DB8F|nr:poly-gamma-glutamate biosynthesis protein PgsC [Sedimentibacter sp. B4]